ncbi:hypothetical protein AAE02nite_06540 [Adhaeribacter aerolatus]|uniref:Uncharacterized protein n=1 Tax=Adhaeribacter aerolatus TaxID=670289 RepID=A0A512ATI3_9BACT|nr:hypothetical protein [Adhaeribacter aerolatus]GEO02990.1 hypothetical protein AAE02nite_06540 [Adhaeribacter aerolatus]
MKTLILTSLLVGSFLLSNACNSPKKDNGTYMSGTDGATEEATAADRAETLAAPTDSTRVIILRDSLPGDSSAL